MTITIKNLSPEVAECPSDCPQMGARIFMPDTIPFYCNRYECFLGATPSQKTERCAKCRGIPENITAVGLSLIEAYRTDHFTISETKRAFLKLQDTFQKLFVGLVSKTGVQIILSGDEVDKPDALADKILEIWQKKKDEVNSPEMKDFLGVLDAGDLPISRQTKTLLMNLFQVMDKSEKEMLKHILQNQMQAESFLESFQQQPQDKDLLRNVRAVIYEYNQKGLEAERENLRRQQQKNNQMAIDLMLRNQQKGRVFEK